MIMINTETHRGRMDMPMEEEGGMYHGEGRRDIPWRRKEGYTISKSNLHILKRERMSDIWL